jgi:hypothetical protein
MAARNFAIVYEEMARRGLICRERIGNTTLQLTSLRSVVDVGAELVDRGTHIYGRVGENVRVRPAVGLGPQGIGAALREELATGRVVRHVDRLAQRVIAPVTRSLRARGFPTAARQEAERDRRQGLGEDPGAPAFATAAASWLRAAQDHSADGTGGVARTYSLVRGWSPSDAGATGRAVAALLAHARAGDTELLDRSRRMLDFLVSAQLANGGFLGRWRESGEHASQPATFATGQALLGLAAGAAAFGDARYRQGMARAAHWLVETQDSDGCWRPAVAVGLPDDASYDGGAALGLLAAARATPALAYERAALRSIEWLLAHQRPNGWFGRGRIEQPTHPLSDAIAHVFRAVVDAAGFTRNEKLLNAAVATGDSLARVIGLDGFLAGRLRSDWSPAVSWASPSGTAHFAHGLLLLHVQTGRPAHLAAAQRANRFVRRSLRLAGPVGVVGGVKGCFPIDGENEQYAFTAVAAACAIDANAVEMAHAAPPRGARHA